jgi:LuxR family maltose regulon positive regulatory protein
VASLLVQTKLQIPPASSPWLPRPRLVRQLEEGFRAGHALTLVMAPTGSGKTTLLREWASQIEPGDAHFCWLSLDERDNDPFQFWSYFVAALEAQRPGLGEGARTLLQSDPLRPVPAEQVLSLLINTVMQASTHLILTLDDYHVIHDARIHAALNFLIAHTPPQLHLVVSSRSEPPINLALLRARGQLTELRLEALSFTEDEAAAFLGSAMQLDLSPDEIAILERRTEGWIAGLQLAAIALRSISRGTHSVGAEQPDPAGFVRAFGGSHRHVVDYLTGEVLDRQSAEIQSFLLQTSILERLSPFLCDAVSGMTHSQATLEYLERASLFLIPLDDERHWYRYQALWAEVLRTRLQREHPDIIRSLHERASLWFGQQGLLAEAIFHAQQAGQADRAASLIEPVAKAMTMRGEGGTLLRWLEPLPAETIASRPDLLLARAWAQITDGQLDAVEPPLGILSGRTDLPLALQGEIAAVRSMIATVHQDIPVIQRQARLALEYLPPGDSQIRSATILSLGTAAALTGQVLQAAEPAWWTAHHSHDCCQHPGSGA